MNIKEKVILDYGNGLKEELDSFVLVTEKGEAAMCISKECDVYLMIMVYAYARTQLKEKGLDMNELDDVNIKLLDSLEEHILQSEEPGEPENFGTITVD